MPDLTRAEMEEIWWRIKHDCNIPSNRFRDMQLIHDSWLTMEARVRELEARIKYDQETETGMWEDDTDRTLP